MRERGQPCWVPDTCPPEPAAVLPLHTPCPWPGLHPAVMGVVEGRGFRLRGQNQEAASPSTHRHFFPVRQLCVRGEEGRGVVSSPAQSVCKSGLQ